MSGTPAPPRVPFRVATTTDPVTGRRQLVTTPASTFLDLSDELGLVDLVVAGDSLVKAGVITPEQLVEAAGTYRGKARRLVRRAASLVRARVDSPMESRVRMLMVLAGLPEPVVDHRIRWSDGRQRAGSDEQWDLAVPA